MKCVKPILVEKISMMMVSLTVSLLERLACRGVYVKGNSREQEAVAREAR